MVLPLLASTLMTVIAPPPARERLEPFLEPGERDELEALIEEARRRARRRRRRHAACALLAAALSAWFALNRGGGNAPAPDRGRYRARGTTSATRALCWFA
jgi:hypothetical protein